MENETGFIALLEHREFDAQLGGLIGLLIGDALGCPYEFHLPDQLPGRELIEMVPPANFRRSHAGVLPGTWTDDGSQALCLLASLLEQGRCSLVDFSDKLLKWLDTGFMAVGREVFDVGSQTAEALGKLRDGASPQESGGKSEMDNGNGSLMRVLPLALWHWESDEALVGDAHLQSLPTHAHPRSMVACAFYCLLARGYLTTLDDPWTWADLRLQEVYESWSNPNEGKVFLTELDILRDFPTTSQPRGSGYVIDTLFSVSRALKEKTFEDVVRSAILFGNDTDTTAAVADGLAGIKFGVTSIPERWLQQLRGIELIEPLVDGLLGRIEATQRKVALSPLLQLS